MALWLVYVMHSEIDGQGLMGWLDELSIRFLGSASTSATLIAAVLLGQIPIGLASRLLARALGVTLVPRNFGVGRPGSSVQILPRSVPVGIAVLITTGLLIYMAVPSYDQSRPPRFDLDVALGGDPPSAARVAVVGTPQQSLTAGYRKQAGSVTTTYRYIPLTGRGWTPETPVRFLVSDVRRSDEPYKQSIISAAAPDGRIEYQGRLRRNGLPALAGGAIDQGSIQIADPYWVIYNDGEQTMYLLILISLLGLPLGLGLLFGVRHRQRQ